MTDVRTHDLVASLVRLHSVVDMDELAQACGAVVDLLAGAVHWRVRLCDSSQNGRAQGFGGEGAAVRPSGLEAEVDPGSETHFELRFQGDIVGNLYVRAVGLSNSAPWLAMADHLGAALVKLQLWMQAEEESCHRRMAQEVLGDISAILGSFDVEYLLARSLEQVLRVVGSDVGSVMLWDGERFSTSVVLGLPEEITRGIRLEGEPVAELVARAGESLFINDPDLEDVPETVRAVHLSVLLVIPLVSGGRVVGVLQAANPLFTDPASPGVVAAEGICRLTAVAVENALLHREAVQRERMATIGQVMAGLSHDIKNMLQSVKAGFYFLQMGVEAKSLNDVEEAVPLIGGAMERISSLVLDMLNYSKGRKPVCGPVNLNVLTEEIVGTMSPVAAEKNVILKASADPEAETVLADSTEVFRCLSNLVTNAIEAVNDGGTVEICTLRAGDGSMAGITVRDDGPGIAEEDQERIFDALFTTKGSKGTGLGLAVTKKIIEEHGGEIRLNSEPGRGTAFTIRLPRTA